MEFEEFEKQELARIEKRAPVTRNLNTVDCNPCKPQHPLLLPKNIHQHEVWEDYMQYGITGMGLDDSFE